MKKLFVFFTVFCISVSQFFCLSLNPRYDIFLKNLPDFYELTSYYKSYYDDLLEKAVSSYVNCLSFEEQAAQLFHVSFPDSNYLYKRGNSPAPGGFLYFAFNISNYPEELISQNYSIRNFYLSNGQIPPFYSVDCEGGAVNRLSSVSGTILSPATVASVLTKSTARSYLKAVSEMIRTAGFDINLAPVIEQKNENNKEFLQSRSYGSLEDVYTYAGIFIEEMNKSHVYSVIKHFPGNTNADPHVGLPVLNLSTETYADEYLSLFEHFLANFDVGVLAAHTVVPIIDSKPVCLSPIHMKSLRQIHSVSDDFLIFSDDLLMKALTQNGYPPSESVITAVRAGVDVIMLSLTQWESYLDDLLITASEDDSLRDSIITSCHKILKWKCRNGLLTVTAQNVAQDISLHVSLPKSYTEEELHSKIESDSESFRFWKMQADMYKAEGLNGRS